MEVKIKCEMSSVYRRLTSSPVSVWDNVSTTPGSVGDSCEGLKDLWFEKMSTCNGGEKTWVVNLHGRLPAVDGWLIVDSKYVVGIPGPALQTLLETTIENN
jgi:hypothetical protein